MTALSSRRTGTLRDLQRHLAMALGGEAGARLATRLAIPISPDTLLRLASTRSRAETGQSAPRVLGVDDWAWRRGHRYGTILVDLERNEPIDLLPDRSAGAVANWLKRNPGVEIVARDRASVYSEGARQGAPDALQVADRWHVLRNLSEAVRSALERSHVVIQRVARAMAMDHAPRKVSDIAAPLPVLMPPSQAKQGSSRRGTLFDEASRLHAVGMSLSRISRLVGPDCKTLRRWFRAGALPSWRQPRRGSMIDAHRAHLERRWAEGCRNASLLWRELAGAGFEGGYTLVKDWAAQRCKAEPDGGTGQVERGAWQPPASRRATRLLMAEQLSVDTTEGNFVARLLESSPALASTVAVAKRLAALLRRKSDETLAGVLADARATMIRTFAIELGKDFAAVQAALESPWTTSPVEGQISRLKMLKRTMYGRAGFHLLRARVLDTSS